MPKLQAAIMAPLNVQDAIHMSTTCRYFYIFFKVFSLTDHDNMAGKEEKEEKKRKKEKNLFPFLFF